MSYFTLDVENQNVINMKEGKIADKNTVQPIKKRNHQGMNNPHFGHKQSEESKRRISDTQKQRYEGYKQTMTEDKVRDICHQVLNEYINRNAKPINNSKPININL